jgi:hypothetical protein
MNASLMKEFTKEEVGAALSQMGPLKSPVPKWTSCSILP